MREGIIDALAHGQSVTAKISWLTHSAETHQRPASQSSSSFEGKPRWIHCTPLLGSDEQVGVWMVVMVENEEVTGGLNRRGSEVSASLQQQQVGGVSDKRFTGSKLYAEYLRREGGGSQRTQRAGVSSEREMSVRGLSGGERDHFRDF